MPAQHDNNDADRELDQAQGNAHDVTVQCCAMLCNDGGCAMKFAGAATMMTVVVVVVVVVDSIVMTMRRNALVVMVMCLPKFIMILVVIRWH